MATKKRIRKSRIEREQELAKAGRELAEVHGLYKVNHGLIAEKVGCSLALVFSYFNTIEILTETLASQLRIADVTKYPLSRLEADIYFKRKLKNS